MELVAPLKATGKEEGQGLDISRVTLILAVIRSEKLTEVLEAICRLDVQGLTVSRAQGDDGERERVQTYRGTPVEMELSEKIRLEIGGSNPFVEPTVRAIQASAHRGEVGDGKRFVLPLEMVHQGRTRKEDRAAVTPVGVDSHLDLSQS